MVATFESVKKDIASKTLKPVYLLKGEESYYLEALSEEFENSILDEAEKDFNLSIFYGKDAQIDDNVSNDINLSAQEELTSDKVDTTSKEITSKKQSTDGKKSDKRTNSKEKKEGCFKKIKCTIREFCDKIKNIKEFLVDETHIQAFLRLKKELLFFIRKIKPDKINGYLRFGLEDPYNTGRVLAALSMLYPFYGEHFEVYPEFEREIIEGDIYFKGRIHLVHLLLALGRAYLDKNIKTAYENLKALKG